MYIIFINKCMYNYYISNKGFLQECDKEENVAVTGAATNFRLKRCKISTSNRCLVAIYFTSP